MDDLVHKESVLKPIGLAVGAVVLFSVLYSASPSLASFVLLALSVAFIYVYRDKKTAAYQIVRGLSYAVIIISIIGLLIGFLGNARDIAEVAAER